MKQFLTKAIDDFKNSEFFKRARLGNDYFYGFNETILNRRNTLTTIKSSTGNALDLDVNKAKISTNIFGRLTIQQVGTLLNWGLQTKNNANKNKLGEDFDTNLSLVAEKSITHGKAYIFYNDNQTQILEAYGNGGFNGCFLLQDEDTSINMIAIRFHQIDRDKPMYVEVFELDGKTKYRIKGEEFIILQPKKPYKEVKFLITNDTLETFNYSSLPVVELRYDQTGMSALTKSLQTLIDRMDILSSDYADVMERIKSIWWIFNNFSGDIDDLIEIKKEVETLGMVLAREDSTADLKTVDIPFLAVEYALKLYEKQVYKDFMAYNTDEITGGSLTNVAIKSAMENHLKKVGRWERQHVIKFVRQILLLAGADTTDIKFRYDVLMNENETNQTIIDAYNSRILDRETALSKLSFIDPSEVQDILKRTELAELSIVPDVDDVSDGDNVE